ncbi:hypothetical protein [Azospirillum sp. sgz301742]
MRDLFAAWAVTPAGYPGYPEPKAQGNRENPSNINAVTSVTPVTPQNDQRPPAHVRDEQDMRDDFEELAARLEFQCGMSRADAERQAWQDVFELGGG